jgi:hypothetical protein
MSDHSPQDAKVNNDPPKVRCGMCGGRCRRDQTGRAWIECRSGCYWSSCDARRVGLVWRIRVWLGWGR